MKIKRVENLKLNYNQFSIIGIQDATRNSLSFYCKIKYQEEPSYLFDVNKARKINEYLNETSSLSTIYKAMKYICIKQKDSLEVELNRYQHYTEKTSLIIEQLISLEDTITEVCELLKQF